jgi:hypothetical protein
LLFCIALVGPLTVLATAKPEELPAMSRATLIVAFIVFNIVDLLFDETVLVTANRSADPRLYSRLDLNLHIERTLCLGITHFRFRYWQQDTCVTEPFL